MYHTPHIPLYKYIHTETHTYIDIVAGVDGRFK